VGPSIAHLAPCLYDPSPDVVKLARAFFLELNVKHNVVYNQMPNIISFLVHEDNAVSLLEFTEAMQFLAKFLVKDQKYKIKSSVRDK
jgi:hypothetical protein